LAGLYHYLNMDADPKKPAAAVIWDHDAIILDQGQQFYRDLATRFGVEDWQVLCACLDAEPPAAMEPLWEEIQAAHRGFQAGLELLGLVVQCALAVDFDALGVHPDLTVDIPDRLRDPEVQARARKILIPPPTADANEIVAVSGGMFYAQETPGTPNFLDVGTHFDIGDPLYIIEVMKMFNKVYAEFAGTVTEVLIERGDGVIVKKGQPLYRIEPDEKSEQLDLDSQQAVRLTYTREAMQRMRRTA
jgi:biotin carboxyl carrier protein